MTDHSLPILATVALIVDLPDENLSRGQIGTVVEHLRSDDEIAELVEFDDDGGEPFALVTVSPEHLILLHREHRVGRQKAAVA
jgi:hypothetical protein